MFKIKFELIPEFRSTKRYCVLPIFSLKCAACYTPFVKLRIQEKKLPHSYMLVANKNNDTARDSLENFKSRVKHRFRKVMHAGEQRQKTRLRSHRVHFYCTGQSKDRNCDETITKPE